VQIPFQISLHGIARSDALYNAIREKADRLERYYDRIMSCRVVLELVGRHKRKGKEFSVRIDLKVPGGELAVTREPDENLQVALRDAFDAARRQLGALDAHALAGHRRKARSAALAARDEHDFAAADFSDRHG
jgi:ribosomal subunit interface protein